MTENQIWRFVVDTLPRWLTETVKLFLWGRSVLRILKFKEKVISNNSLASKYGSTIFASWALWHVGRVHWIISAYTGRAGNSWESPKGCLMFSFTLQMSDGSAVPFLQYVASLAIIEAIESHCISKVRAHLRKDSYCFFTRRFSNHLWSLHLWIGQKSQSTGMLSTRLQCTIVLVEEWNFVPQGLKAPEVKIKWPNDLYAKGLKVGGILCTSTYSSKKFHIVVGELGIEFWVYLWERAIYTCAWRVVENVLKRYLLVNVDHLVFNTYNYRATYESLSCNFRTQELDWTWETGSLQLVSMLY